MILVSFTIEPDSTKTKKKDDKEWNMLYEMEQKYSKQDYNKHNKNLLDKLDQLDSIMQDTSGQIKTGIQTHKFNFY